MTDKLRCSGHRGGNQCIHGFRVSAACWPLSLEHAERTRPPMCVDEERCGELFVGNGGKPYPTFFASQGTAKD